MASSSSSSPSIHFPVEQRTKEWEQLRRPISGTTLSKLLGFCSFSRPNTTYIEAVTGERKPFANTEALDHGNKYESTSEQLFLRLTADRLKQIYTEPGYDVPDPLVNRLFTEERDALRFGVSLDVRGSEIDCEIKNPTSLMSFRRYYEKIFSPAYFLQVQWAMAVRNRTRMYFIATSYDKTDGKLFAYGVWMVEFAEEFFRSFILPAARRIADRLLAKDLDYDLEADESPWINENGVYTRSAAYSTLFHKYCKRVIF